ncbi:MAG: molybdopterin-guanine dinucleotide biosynthesis protein B [Candidatus Pristimantibacillus sp.]
MNNSDVYQIVGYKNSGKTSLICRLIHLYTEQGKQVAVIKHDGHSFEADPQGSDTHRLRDAGAAWSAITSNERTAIVMETAASIGDLINEAPLHDLLLVEGFKQERYPKLVLIRDEKDEALACRLHSVTAVAVWPNYIKILDPMKLPAGTAIFEIDDTLAIAEHIMTTIAKERLSVF